MDRKRKRCPNGMRMNKTTKKCEKISVKGKKTMKKKCPPNKPLYNPKTDRCITDNPLNRKKLGMAPARKSEPSVAPAPKPKAVVNKRKVCPPNKPLYNPKTNRCVTDNALNRKKLGMAPAPKQNKNKFPVYNITKCNDAIYEDIDFNKIEGTIQSGILVIKYNNITLKSVSILGEGSYGIVRKYSDSTGKINVAVKIFYRKDDDEIKVLKALEAKNVDCNILACKLVGSKERPVIVCDLYNNSLKDTKLTSKLTIETKVKIVKQLAIDLLCLYDKGLPYTDIKLENTLYKCLSNNRFRVTLGDIGSICLKNFKGVTTYPPWEYRREAANIECGEKQIVWGLGVLLVCLIKNTNLIYPFYWEELENFGDTEYGRKYVMDRIYDIIEEPTIKNYIIPNKKTISGNPLRLSTVIYAMLRLNPKDRAGLRAVISNL